MTQSEGAENTFLVSVTLYNFQKRGGWGGRAEPLGMVGIQRSYELCQPRTHLYYISKVAFFAALYVVL